MYEIRFTELLLLRNAPSVIRMFEAFTTLYKSTLRRFSHAKYNPNADVGHVATKLLKIVGNFLNSIICVIMVFCVDDAA